MSWRTSCSNRSDRENARRRCNRALISALDISMLDLKFVPLTRDRHAGPVLAMMQALFDEDPPSSPVDASRFPATIELLLAEPSRGTILLIEEQAVTCGYAILVPYWSNEFGGTILYIDELFVIPRARNRGIAHRLFEFLALSKPFDAIALALEVSPANARAQRLYESLGFSARRNSTLLRRLGRPKRTSK